jgi:excisionase family DNA binding protein
MTCEPLIDAKAAAVLMDSNPKTVKRMAQRREIPAIQIGNRWKFRASEIDEWMRRGLVSHCHPLPPNGGTQ